MQDVLYAAPLKYLLVALRDGDAARSAFSILSPNTQRLKAAHSGGLLIGVIVTVQGELVALPSRTRGLFPLAVVKASNPSPAPCVLNRGVERAARLSLPLFCPLGWHS